MLSAVFMVNTCLSMNPLTRGSGGDEEWSIGGTEGIV